MTAHVFAKSTMAEPRLKPQIIYSCKRFIVNIRYAQDAKKTEKKKQAKNNVKDYENKNCFNLINNYPVESLTTLCH